MIKGPGPCVLVRGTHLFHKIGGFLFLDKYMVFSSLLRNCRFLYFFFLFTIIAAPIATNAQNKVKPRNGCIYFTSFNSDLLAYLLCFLFCSSKIQLIQLDHSAAKCF